MLEKMPGADEALLKNGLKIVLLLHLLAAKVVSQGGFFYPAEGKTCW